MLTQTVFAAQPNVAGIILAGSADFKTELSQSDLFDIRQACPKRLSLADRIANLFTNRRLQAVIVNIVDVSYGGENGFNQVCVVQLKRPRQPFCVGSTLSLTPSLKCQAIELSTDILANVKFIQEKKLIAKCARHGFAPAAVRLDSRSVAQIL